MYAAIWKRKVIYQLQLTDYLGELNVIFFDMSFSNHRYYYRKLLRGVGIKRRKKKFPPRTLSKAQTTLDPFLPKAAELYSKGFKMPYRQRIIMPPLPPHLANSAEFIALQNYSTARGYLKHLFQLNSLAFWEHLPYSASQQHLYTHLSAADVFRLEMARYKLGFRRYGLWVMFLKRTPSLLDAVQLTRERIPDASQYGQLVAQLGSHHIKQYFLELVQECIRLNLIDSKIIIWDGRFLASNCAKNENKRLNRLADPDAGKYKHIGTYRGVGYVDSSFVCAKCNLPVYYQSFPANRNDNISFRQTFRELKSHNFPAPKILIADAGPYSNKSLQLVKAAGIVPLIYARKNIKKHVIKVGPRKYINISYVPPAMIPHLTRLLNLRTLIEQDFSPARTVYNAYRMNNRGMENARMNIGKLKCIELLTALTALKAQRLDLLNSSSAFRHLPAKLSAKFWDQVSSTQYLGEMNPERRMARV